MTQFKGYYKKTKSERKDILRESGCYDNHLDIPLSEDIYTNMIENALTTYELPYGLAPNFLINGRTVHVPMVTEEPSVIAAASNGAKFVRESGGFSAVVSSRLMRGEIVFEKSVHPQTIIDYINQNQTLLHQIADEAYPSIVKRGGGVRSFTTRLLPDFIIVDVLMDTQEAMGANMLNTVLEKLAVHLQMTLDQEPLISILSNLSTECLVEVTCAIDITLLKYQEETAKKIVLASKLAQQDVYRATTHNKGIMNGIDAVVIASGNDSRAINAGVHAFASLSGTYQPLATWSIANNKLCGKLELPMAIGTVGGSIRLNPKAQLSRKIMNYQNATELMEIIASVGLAQNFAALNALTTDGIQKGHMALQARALALSAGATNEEVETVVAQLVKVKTMNLETALAIITALRKM